MSDIQQFLQKQQLKSDKKGENIKVVIRIRPISQKEKKQNKTSIAFTKDDKYDQNADKKIFLTNFTKGGQQELTPKQYAFDKVYDQPSTQEDIFENIGKPMTLSVMEGYNTCLFCYGQTGAGKTYTMQGDLKDSKSEHRGLQIRVFEYLFSLFQEIQQSQTDTQFLVSASYFEIYNEQILDLLSTTGALLQVREDIKTGVYIEGLQDETIGSVQDAIKLLNIGARNRHVSATDMNLESSRSHSVFTLHIESKQKLKSNVNVVKTSRMNFVDLAGSERQQSTNAVGERLKEANNINKSLTVLGLVINSLVEQSSGKSRHIPYRDSKLTFILKDSLGGNSKTCIIAAVSPSQLAYQETLSTLKFAQRAKMIQNKATINEESSGSIEVLKKEIQILKQLLDKEKSMVLELQQQKMEIEEARLQQEDQIQEQQQEKIVQEYIINKSDQKDLSEYLEQFESQELLLQTQLAKKENEIEKLQEILEQYALNEIHYRMILELYQNKFHRQLMRDQKQRIKEEMEEEEEEFVDIEQGYQSPEKSQIQKQKIENLMRRSNEKRNSSLGEQEDTIEENNDILQGFQCTFNGDTPRSAQKSNPRSPQKTMITPIDDLISEKKEEIESQKQTPSKKSVLNTSICTVEDNLEFMRKENTELLEILKNKDHRIENLQFENEKLNVYSEMDRENPTSSISIMEELQKNLEFMNSLKNSLKVNLDSNAQFIQQEMGEQKLTPGMSPPKLNFFNTLQKQTPGGASSSSESNLLNFSPQKYFSNLEELKLFNSTRKPQQQQDQDNSVECRLTQCMQNSTKIQDLENDKVSLEKDVAQLNVQIKNLEETLLNTKGQLMKAQAEAGFSTNDQSMLLAPNLNHTQEIFQEQIHMERIHTLETEKLNLENDKKGLETEKQTLEKDKQGLEKEIKTLQESETQMKSEMQDVIKKLMEKKEQIKSQKSEAKMVEELHNEKVKSLENKLSHFVSEKASEKAKIISENEELQKQNQEIKYELNDLQEEHQTLYSTYNCLEAQTKELNEKIEGYELAQVRLNKEKDLLFKEVLSYEKKQNEYNKEMQQNSDKQKATFNIQMKDIDELKSINHELRLDIEQQSKAKEKYRVELTQINSQFEYIKNSEEQYKSAFLALKQEIITCKKNSETLRDLLQEKEEEIAKLEQEILFQKQKVIDVMREKEQTIKLLSKAKSERFNAEQQWQYLKDEFKQVQEQLAKTLEEKKELQEEIEQLNVDKNKQIDENSIIKSQIKTLSESSKDFMEFYKKQSEDTLKLKHLLQHKISEHAKLQDDYKHSQNQNRIQKVKLEKLEKDIANQKEKTKNLTKKYKKQKQTKQDVNQVIKDYEWDIKSHELRILELLDYIVECENFLVDIGEQVEKQFVSNEQQIKDGKDAQKTLEESKQQLENYQGIINNQSKELYQLKIRSNQLQSENQQQQEHIVGLEQKKYATAIEVEKNKEIQDLRDEFHEQDQNQQKQIFQLINKKDMVYKQLKVSQSVIEQTKEVIVELSSQNDYKNTQIKKKILILNDLLQRYDPEHADREVYINNNQRFQQINNHQKNNQQNTITKKKILHKFTDQPVVAAEKEYSIFSSDDQGKNNNQYTNFITNNNNKNNSSSSSSRNNDKNNQYNQYNQYNSNSNSNSNSNYNFNNSNNNNNNNFKNNNNRNNNYNKNKNNSSNNNSNTNSTYNTPQKYQSNQKQQYSNTNTPQKSNNNNSNNSKPEIYTISSNTTSNSKVNSYSSGKKSVTQQPQILKSPSIKNLVGNQTKQLEPVIIDDDIEQSEEAQDIADKMSKIMQKGKQKVVQKQQFKSQQMNNNNNNKQGKKSMKKASPNQKNNNIKQQQKQVFKSQEMFEKVELNFMNHSENEQQFSDSYMSKQSKGKISKKRQPVQSFGLESILKQQKLA